MLRSLDSLLFTFLQKRFPGESRERYFFLQSFTFSNPSILVFLLRLLSREPIPSPASPPLPASRHLYPYIPQITLVTPVCVGCIFRINLIARLLYIMDQLFIVFIDGLNHSGIRSLVGYGNCCDSLCINYYLYNFFMRT